MWRDIMLPIMYLQWSDVEMAALDVVGKQLELWINIFQFIILVSKYLFMECD